MEYRLSEAQRQELAACPFCGGEAYFSIQGAINRVSCMVCYTETLCWNTREQALSAWNRRVAPSQVKEAPSDAAEREIEKLEAMANRWHKDSRQARMRKAILKEYSTELKVAIAALRSTERKA